jgi:alpha-1,6-mannosyltransferase
VGSGLNLMVAAKTGNRGPKTARARAAVHLLCCVAFVLGAAWVHAVAARAPEGRGSAYIALHALLAVAMLGAWLTGTSGSHDTGAGHGPGLRSGAWTRLLALHGVLAAGGLALLLLLAVPSFTTHDVQRYLWDGAVASAGLDPYRVAPDSAEALSLRAVWPTPAEHAAYPTLYPPGALALFALSSLAGPVHGVWVWKALAIAAGISTLLVAQRLLAQRGALQHLPLLAMSPLLLLETGVGAHVDAFSTLAVVLALWAWQSGRLAWAGAAIGLGAIIKLLPMVLLWPLAVALLAQRRWLALWRLLLGAGLVVALGYGLALACGLLPVGSLGLLFQRWRFGSPLHAALEWLLQPAEVSAWLALLLALLLVLLLLGSAWLARRDLARAVQLALAAPLLISPVVFPWYLSVLLPALVLRPHAVLLAWICVAPVSYEVLNAYDSSGIWAPAVWPLWAIAASWLLGAVLQRVFGQHPLLAASTCATVPSHGRFQTQGVLAQPDQLATTLATEEGCLTPRVAIVPAYNEAPAIVTVVQQTLALRDAQGQPLFARVIVVDNASNDATAQLARDAGAEVVFEGERGYGAACLAGLAAAPDAGTAVFIDGDASVDLTQIAALLAPLAQGADLVIGARHDCQPGAMSWPQRVGNLLASGLIRLLWRAPVSDLGPFRAMRGPALRQLGMQDRRFGWTVEMQVRAIQHGLCTVEVPVRLLPRVGRSKISGTFKGVLGAAHGIFSVIGALWWTQHQARRRRLPSGSGEAPQAKPDTRKA